MQKAKISGEVNMEQSSRGGEACDGQYARECLDRRGLVLGPPRDLEALVVRTGKAIGADLPEVIVQIRGVE